MGTICLFYDGCNKKAGSTKREPDFCRALLFVGRRMRRGRLRNGRMRRWCRLRTLLLPVVELLLLALLHFGAVLHWRRSSHLRIGLRRWCRSPAWRPWHRRVRLRGLWLAARFLRRFSCTIRFSGAGRIRSSAWRLSFWPFRRLRFPRSFRSHIRRRGTPLTERPHCPCRRRVSRRHHLPIHYGGRRPRPCRGTRSHHAGPRRRSQSCVRHRSIREFRCVDLR